VDGDLQDRLQACLFARGGSILPLGPEVLHTGEAPEGATTLLVVPGEGGRARGRLYHDAGDGFGYRNGDYRLVTYLAEMEDGRVDLTIQDTRGWRPRPEAPVAVELLQPSGLRRELNNGPY